MFNSKVFLAEFIGTFALVFIGAGAGIANAGLVGVALAHGFTLAVFVYAYGHISGTHVNPAVTWALVWNGTIKWGQAWFYWIAQFGGAILAGFLLKLFVGDISNGMTVGSLTASAPVKAMIVEAILTFFLVNTILHTAVAGNGGKFAGWAIGTTLAFAILAGGPLTGASLNPARTIGLSVFSAQSFTDLNTYVIYFFGPLIGSTFALIVFNFFYGMEEVIDAELVVEATVVKAKKSVTRKTTKKN